MKYDTVIFKLKEGTSYEKTLSQITRGTSVLECGCATGYMTRYMKEKLNCSVYIIEYEEEAFNRAKRYAVDGVCADLTKDDFLPRLKGMQFDFILFCDVLEHLIDPAAVLRKLAPYLKEDGKILISLPNVAHNDVLCKLFNNHWDYMDLGLLDNTHLRFFARNNIDALIESAGYSIIMQDYVLTPTFLTEQMPEEVPASLVRALQDRVGGEVYQFVLTVQKKEYVEAHQIQKEDRSESLTPKALMPETMNATGAEYRRLYEACVNSYSWKVTKPLRKLGDMLFSDKLPHKNKKNEEPDAADSKK